MLRRLEKTTTTTDVTLFQKYISRPGPKYIIFLWNHPLGEWFTPFKIIYIAKEYRYRGKFVK